MKTSEQIELLFREKGDSEYGGESVTQLEHALQCATFALQEGASDVLVVAALLHDVGHLVHCLPDDAPDMGIDDLHESLGYDFLKTSFPEAVVAPVKMHVDAKRYLCAVDSLYESQLSEPSRLSLKLQGGMMSQEEVAAFENNPYWKEAVQIRRWDDMGKILGLKTPDIQHFLPIIDRVAQLRSE